MVEKHGVLAAHYGAVGEVALQGLGGFAGQRSLALLAAFAAHAQPALGAVQIFQVQSGQLADAQPAAVEELEDGAVAHRMRALQLAGSHAVDQRVGLLGGHHLGQLLGALGVRSRRAVLIFTRPSRSRKAKQTAHGGQLAADADGT